MNGQTRRENLRRLLRPRHIAMVGGRAIENAIGHARAIGFEGAIACHGGKADGGEGFAGVHGPGSSAAIPAAFTVLVGQPRRQNRHNAFAPPHDQH